VGQGTFYLYFKGKKQVFDELVEDLNCRVRYAMSAAIRDAGDRLEAERLGFGAFFRFTAEHPGLYRIIRQAEFVSPEALKLHYTRIVEAYSEGLRQARDAGQIADVDPAVAAWVLMGIGEIVGLRWVLWGDSREVPQHVLDETIRLIQRALRP
jgi:AcrR family transcriptional regulator